jgi:HAE1 family hydrophobic/amphiphilic exporter-1
MSTCTNIIVFLPLMLMGGIGDMAFWMLRIGVPVIVSLVASLFIALVFVPLAAQRLSRGRHHEELKPVRWLRTHYVTALRWVLNHRVNATMLVLIAGGLTWRYYATTPLQRPNYYQGLGGWGGGTSSMWLYFELPSGGTLEDADVFFRSFETFLQGGRQLYNVERIETRFRYNNGQVQLKFREDPNKQWYRSAWNAFAVWAGWRKVPMDQIAIETHIRENFKFPPGVMPRSFQRGSGPGDANMSIALYGEDTTTLIGLAEEAVRRLRLIPGLVSVETDMERGGQELQVQLDRDRARRLGINPQAIQTNISNTIRGSEVGRFNAPDGREMRVYAQLGDVDRVGLDDLRSMTFRTDGNVEVPLESIASLNATRTLSQIQREARQTIMRIQAKAPRVDSRSLFAAVDKAMRDSTCRAATAGTRELLQSERVGRADGLRALARGDFRVSADGDSVRIVRAAAGGHHRRAVCLHRRVLDALSHRHALRQHGEDRHRDSRRRGGEQRDRFGRHGEPAARRRPGAVRGARGGRTSSPAADPHDHALHRDGPDSDGAR